eukprot:4634508-Alexandrium_andersonii.AAC.1
MPNAPRASVLLEAHTAPEVAMDYCFLTKDGSGTSLTVLALKDRNSRAILARPVLRKGRLREDTVGPVSYTHLRAHETSAHL